MATVNLNKLASALVGNKSKVRLRVVAGPQVTNGVLTSNPLEFQIRPTNRVSGKTLPAREILIDLRAKRASAGAFCGPNNTFATGALRFTLPKEVDMVPGQAFRLLPRKHGWLALVPVDIDFDGPTLPGQPKPAGCSISER